MPKPNRKPDSSDRVHISPNGDRQGPGRKFAQFADRLISSAKEAGLSAAQIARELGVTSGTFSRYWNGERLPPAETLVDLAELLGVSAAWLVRGTHPDRLSRLRDADDADWVETPKYDLREITAAGKGDVLASTPFRRDWLNTVFGKSDVWLSRMPTDYLPLDLEEGDRIICADIDANELHERNLCVWRENETNRFVIGRFSAAIDKSVYIDNAGEYWVGRLALGYRDSKDTEHPAEFEPVARILGRPLAPIR